MRQPMKYPADLGSLIGGLKGGKLASNPVWQIGHKWESIAGESVAAHSHPARVSNNVLYVTVNNSSWMQELMFYRHILLEKVRSVFPKFKVRDVRFELGSLPRTRPHLRNTQVMKREIAPEENQIIEQCSSLISNEDISSAAKDAMTAFFRNMQRLVDQK